MWRRQRAASAANPAAQSARGPDEPPRCTRVPRPSPISDMPSTPGRAWALSSHGWRSNTERDAATAIITMANPAQCVTARRVSWRPAHVAPKKTIEQNELMIVNDSPGEECRIAILEDGHLEELYT